MLIERGPGVSTKPIKTAYSAVAGTAFVTFDKVTFRISGFPDTLTHLFFIGTGSCFQYFGPNWRRHVGYSVELQS